MFYQHHVILYKYEHKAQTLQKLAVHKPTATAVGQASLNVKYYRTINCIPFDKIDQKIVHQMERCWKNYVMQASSLLFYGMMRCYWFCSVVAADLCSSNCGAHEKDISIYETVQQ